LVVGIDTPVAALTARARELWECLAGTAAGFTPAISVAVSPRSYLCSQGRAGIVVLGAAALATAPDRDTARFVGQALSGLPAASLTDTEVLSSRLPVAEIIGPAALAYLDPADFRPRPGDAITTPLGLDHPGFRQFLAAADTDDVKESGIQEISTPAFAVREHGQVVAAAGYEDWPCGTAHLSMLTAPQREAAVSRVPPRQPPSPTRSRKAGCRNGGHAPRPPGASPTPWDSANLASR